MVWLLLRQRTVILDMIRDKGTRVQIAAFSVAGLLFMPAGLSVRDPVDEFRNGYGASEYFRAADRYLRLYHDEDASRPVAGDFHRPGSVRRLSACYGGKTGQSGAVCAGPFIGSWRLQWEQPVTLFFPARRWSAGEVLPVTGMGLFAGGINFFAAIRAWYIPEGFDAGAFVLMLLIILVGTVGAFSLVSAGNPSGRPRKGDSAGLSGTADSGFSFCRLDGLLLFPCGLHRVCGNSGHRRSSEIVPEKSLEEKTGRTPGENI